MIAILNEDPPPSPTFRHLLLFVLPLSLKVIVVLQQDPPLCRKLLICAFPLSLMVIVVLHEDSPLSPTFRHLLLLFARPPV